MVKELFRDKTVIPNDAADYVDSKNSTLTGAGLNVRVIPTGQCQTCADLEINNHSGPVPVDK